MEILVSNLRKILSLYDFVRLTLCLVVLTAYTKAQELTLARAVQILSTGPTPYVQCTATNPEGITHHSITWISNGKELFMNELKRADTSPRYHVSYMPHQQNPRTYISNLIIYNAVKQDEGLYQCRVEYVEDSIVKYLMDDITIDIAEYLPAENYPECTLKNSNGSLTANSVTFTCLVGDSNPSVDLTLALNRTDGSENQFGEESYSGNASATIQVPASEENVTFICYMTSDLFKTAYRTCSVGPINVHSLDIVEIPSTNSVSTTKFVQSTMLEKITTSESSLANRFPLPVIIGAAGGGFILLFLIVIICVAKRKKKNSSNRPDHLMDNTDLSQITRPSANRDSGMYAYADVQNTGISALSKPNSSNTISNTDGYKPSAAPKPINQASNQDSDMYAYADAHNFGNHATVKPNSSDNSDHTDKVPSKPGKASDFPIYSQVNKHFENKESRIEDDDGQDSGMVENIVYVSSGPK